MVFVSSFGFPFSLSCSYSFPRCFNPILFYFIYLFVVYWTTLPLASVLSVQSYDDKWVFLYLCLDLCLPTHSGCRLLSLHLVILSHTYILRRTALDEGSARHRDLYLSPHNTHKRETSMPPAGFEPAIPAGERQQTCALDRAAPGIGWLINNEVKRIKILDWVTEEKPEKSFWG